MLIRILLVGSSCLNDDHEAVLEIAEEAMGELEKKNERLFYLPYAA
jgi:hypothetical protein